jgi:hypothetical protein
MSGYTVTHVTIEETPPPWLQRQGEIVAVIRDISPRREEEPAEDELVRLEDEAEVKVVAPRRGRRPKANEAAETK